MFCSWTVAVGGFCTRDGIFVFFVAIFISKTHESVPHRIWPCFKFDGTVWLIVLSQNLVYCYSAYTYCLRTNEGVQRL